MSNKIPQKSKVITYAWLDLLIDGALGVNAKNRINKIRVLHCCDIVRYCGIRQEDISNYIDYLVWCMLFIHVFNLTVVYLNR